MQKPQLEDKHLVESPASVVSCCADQEFTPGRQTAEIVPEDEMEFVQTHYSPRGVVLLYFQGDAAAEVDRHFNRTFAELCCLPGSSEDCMDGSHLQGRPTVPMSQRNLPASFWNPAQMDQSRQRQASFTRHGNAMSVIQENHNATTHYNNCYPPFTGQHGVCEQNAPNVVHARPIPVSYAQLPVGAVKSFVPGLTQQVSAQSCRTAAPSFPQETAAHCNDFHTSWRFNPRYNALLVQPEVKPHLPVVPGEPRVKLDRKNKDNAEDLPGELLTTEGEN